MEKILSKVMESRPDDAIVDYYAEMRGLTLHILDLVIAINDFEKDQEELLNFAYSRIIPLKNPYQELLFDTPEDLLKLNIVNYTPINGKVMSEYGLFIREVIRLMRSLEDSIIPSVDLLSEIIKSAGLRYIQPNLSSLGGTNTMGKTIRKSAVKTAKPSNAELQEMLCQQRAAKVQEITLAKEKAAKAKAEQKALLEAGTAKDEAIKKEAGFKIADSYENINDGELVSGNTTVGGVRIADICAEAVDELTNGKKLIKEEKDMSKANYNGTNAEIINDLYKGQEELNREVDNLREDVDIFNRKLATFATNTSTVSEKKSSLGKKILVGGCILAGAVFVGNFIKGLVSSKDESYAE